MLRHRADTYCGSGDNNPRTLPLVRPLSRSLFGDAACALLPFRSLFEPARGALVPPTAVYAVYLRPNIVKPHTSY